MTNEEYIKQMGRNELADYIYSVFMAGVLIGKNKLDISKESIDYTSWLQEERID